MWETASAKRALTVTQRGLTGLARASRLLLCCVAAAAAWPAAAQEVDQLVGLINAYRAATHSCDGKQMGKVGPLALAPALQSLRPGSRKDLQAALQESGYLAAQARDISVSGPTTARQTMEVLQQHYCQTLLGSRFSDIGAARDGAAWRIVFARPLLSSDLADWHESGKEILRLTNAARAEPRTCGEQSFGKAPALRWRAELASAALAHSQDMAKRNYFAHRGKGGTQVGERTTRQGYRWQRVGENIATGQGSAESVMSAWLSSPQHCANLMQPGFTEMGAAYAINPDSDTTIYRTQVFGARR